MNPYMYNPYGVQQPQYNVPQYTPQRQEVVRVHGRNGADAFNLPPNSSVLLLDEQQPIVYLKTSDGAGYPTITAYKIEPYAPETVENNNLSELEKRIERLETIYESNNNSTPKNKSSNEQPCERA